MLIPAPFAMEIFCSIPVKVAVEIDYSRLNLDISLFCFVFPERSSSSEGKKHHILRTTVSYFRHTPTFDNDHWWLDLNCSLKKDRDLYSKELDLICFKVVQSLPKSCCRLSVILFLCYTI